MGLLPLLDQLAIKNYHHQPLSQTPSYQNPVHFSFFMMLCNVSGGTTKDSKLSSPHTKPQAFVQTSWKPKTMAWEHKADYLKTALPPSLWISTFSLTICSLITYSFFPRIAGQYMSPFSCPISFCYSFHQRLSAHTPGEVSITLISYDLPVNANMLSF